MIKPEGLAGSAGGSRTWQSFLLAERINKPCPSTPAGRGFVRLPATWRYPPHDRAPWGNRM